MQMNPKLFKIHRTCKTPNNGHITMSNGSQVQIIGPATPRELAD